jgi:hypothetical protein
MCSCRRRPARARARSRWTCCSGACMVGLSRAWRGDVGVAARGVAGGLHARTATTAPAPRRPAAAASPPYPL